MSVYPRELQSRLPRPKSWQRLTGSRIDGAIGMQIRVAHLIASNFVGGPEKQILRHAHDAAARGVEVWICSFGDAPESPEILRRANREGIPTFELPSSGRFDFRTVFRLSAFLRREKIEILCSHGYKANLIGLLTHWITKLPQVAFVRGWTAETAQVRIYELLDRLLLPFADRIVCVSEAQAAKLRDSWRFGSRVVVIRNASLLDESIPFPQSRSTAKQILGYAPNTRIVGAAGRLSVEKGHSYLVEAAALLCKELGALKIVILGEGRERRALELQIQQLGLQGNVTLCGFQAEMRQWLAAMDVLVLPSLTEGLPNVLLEGLAMGTPVVATMVGGVPEVVKDRETGLLVPPANPVAIAEAVRSVLENDNLAAKLAQNGYSWVHGEFSPDRQCEQLLAVYADLLGRRQMHVVASGIAGPRQDMQGTTTPMISVVIPVRNEEKHIGMVLRDLIQQDYPADRFEILVADGNSSDGTLPIVEQFAKSCELRIALFPNPMQLSSAGRNLGVVNSRGELIIFIDGHCKIDSPSLLTDYARVMQATGADCLCRAQPLDAPSETWLQEVIAHARASFLGHGRDSTIFSPNLVGSIDPTSSGAAYRSTVFEQVGMFDESFDACEDVEFNYRVCKSGLYSYIDPRLKIHYYPRTNLAGLWKQLLRYGRGRFKFVRKHPEAVSIGQLLPPTMVSWFIVAGIVSILSSLVAKVLLTSLVVYAGMVLAFSIGLGVRHGRHHFLVAPAVYLTIHFALGCGFLLEALRINRRKLPEIPAKDNQFEEARNNPHDPAKVDSRL
jgi:succinoglycan biosynthesis protein ExoA